MNYLPSKSFLLLFSSLLGLGLIVFAVVKIKSELASNNEPTEESIAANIDLSSLKNAELDSDNDGLKDWEETLWKTDPNNKDTDTDGTTDGEEIATNRDPLASGPNDKSAKEGTIRPATGKTDYMKEFGVNTETEALGRKIYIDYLTLKKEGTLTEESKQALIDQTLKNFAPPESTLSYKKEDILINDSVTITNYKTAVTAIIGKYSYPGLGSEITVATGIASGKSQSGREVLLRARATYEKIVEELLLVPTPSAFSASHLGMVNGFAKMSLELESIAGINNDPLVALYSLVNFREGSAAVISGMNSVGITQP